jgi:hypothetical protein
MRSWRFMASTSKATKTSRAEKPKTIATDAAKPSVRVRNTDRDIRKLQGVVREGKADKAKTRARRAKK